MTTLTIAQRVEKERPRLTQNRSQRRHKEGYMRTAQQIVDQTNKLAREFYRLMGYKVPKGHRFDQDRVNRHPQEVLCWNMACAAQYELTATDVEDAQSELEE